MTPAESPDRILVVDDDKLLCELVADYLIKKGSLVSWRCSVVEATALLQEEDFDVVVTDLRMPGTGGLSLCEWVVANRPDLPVLVITAFGSLEAAVSAIRAGAYDFVTKPFDMEAFRLAVTRAAQHRRLRDEVKRLRQAVAEAGGFEEMIGTSPPMRRLYDLLGRAADTDTTVLITGESGTGKELVARALHRRGRRADGPFVAINCAAMPEALLESELFGHARGAFTDARTARTGLFVQSNGGTLFLDEIGELPLGLQPKLLRALQERKVRPVGGSEEIPFEARIVAATNRDLETAIEEGRFREDFYYRINVIHVSLPSLRDRGSDILLLAQHFIDRYAALLGKAVRGVAPAAAERLLAYGWPGNVRELQNCIERAVALASWDPLGVEDLPDKVKDYARSHASLAGEDPAELVSLEEMERRYTLRVLEAVNGNKTLAAKILKVDRTTLYRKLGQYRAT